MQESKREKEAKKWERKTGGFFLLSTCKVSMRMASVSEMDQRPSLPKTDICLES